MVYSKSKEHSIMLFICVDQSPIKHRNTRFCDLFCTLRKQVHFSQ